MNQFFVLIYASCVVDDIEVVFYETEPYTGKRSWEAQGIFSPTDVHRQVRFIGNNNYLK